MKKVIWQNTITSIRVLLTQAEELGFSVAAAEEAEVVRGLNDRDDLTPALGETIATLWADGGIQEAYGNRSRFQLNDSAKLCVW